jgi:hypothetical protein
MAISRKSSIRARRAIAVFGVALILVTQFVGAVHWHPAADSARIVSSTQPTIDTGLCALCQVAFHCTLNPTSAPFIEPLEIGAVIASAEFGLGFDSFDFASALTRAPPAA